MEFKPDFKRLHKVLTRDGEPDILPLYEFFADDSVARQVTGEKGLVDAQISFFLRMGYDYTPIYTNFSYERYTLETKKNSMSDTRSFVDENKGIIETKMDFDAYCWPDIDDSVAKYVTEASAKLPDGMKMIYLLPAGILENVMWLMGYIPFSYAIADDEQLVWDMFEKIGENHLSIARRCLERCDRSKLGAMAMGDDMGFSHSTMISPALLRKFVFPWQKRVAELAHEYGLPFILHACGNLETVMDDLIDYVGIDAKHSFEDKIMPVADAKKKYGGRVAILGGVDMSYLCTASKNDLETYIANVIKNCAPGGGYALGTGNSLADYVPMQSYQVLRDSRAKYGVYPIGR